MGKRQYCDNTHLTLSERIIIETGITNRSTKVAIAKTIGKDPSTIAKEIRKHRIVKPKHNNNYKSNCKFVKECDGCQKNHKRCERYQEGSCSERDRSPGACNGCKKSGACYLTHYEYLAKLADEMYRETLVESRVGINLTPERRNEIAEIVVPLAIKGQSFYQILNNHPEIDLSDKTLYNYVSQGVFKEFGLDSFTLKERVQRKPYTYKKRKAGKSDENEEKKSKDFYQNRTYKDFMQFRVENPGLPVVQMDTVYNNPEGPYIQTFLFENSNLMLGFIHESKTTASMISTFDYLERLLGSETFSLLCPICLTDRGTEFKAPDLFEASCLVPGKKRLKIFYCDPMQSYQKAQIENNHNFLRDIIPNNVLLYSVTDEDLSLAFSHINSTPRKSLNDRTPYDLFQYSYGQDIIDLLGIKKLHYDDVTLRPYLLELIKK